MSETREQQARELIAEWKLWADWEMSPGTEAWWLKALARALAACALEEARWWRAGELARGIHSEASKLRLTALERAAGVK